MEKKEFFNFFIEKGLKSPILDSRGIEKYNADLHSQVIEFKNSFYPNSDRKFSEILYCYLKGIESNPICKNCCKEPTKFKMFSFGYFDYCSVKCSSNSTDKKEAIKKTCIQKYGVENVSLDDHLDHIYPIIEGWKKRIPAIDIANYKNLTLLFHEDNRNKSSKTSLTVEEFYKLIKK